MKLHNTRTKTIETIQPLQADHIRIYSCGPTVYDHAHIGNLSAYIFADTLRRVLAANDYKTTHAMNYTDVDDKTIRRSHEKYSDLAPDAALQKLTDEYITLFRDDMQRIGNDIDALTFLRATDPNVIAGMQKLIQELHDKGFAYVADDGVYFSIEAYRKSGKTYGQLLELTSSNTSEARIQNDEYDKESVHDFALWKVRKEGEPAWPFELAGHNLTGRPGWHIECSVMSAHALGQPFDIHTGGVDLIFPHHENEIAQSTAGKENPIMAQCFTHNEHLLVDGKKMSKSANNFYRLQDIIDHGFDPLAFRLLILQAHYRSQAHFSWENVAAAQNRLAHFRAVASLIHQTAIKTTADNEIRELLMQSWQTIKEQLSDDLNTPLALASFNELIDKVEASGMLSSNGATAFKAYLEHIDSVFGLNLAGSLDINETQKAVIEKREAARKASDYTTSDQLRQQLEEQGITLRDTPEGAIWTRQ